MELGVNKLLFLDGKLEMSRRQRVYDGSGPYHGKMLTLIKTESGVQAFGSDIGSVATFSWIDPAAMVGIGGIFFFCFLRRLAAEPVVPIGDPFLKESIEFENA